MIIDEIKKWVDDLIKMFEENPRDTLPAIWEDNRRLLGSLYRRRDEIKAWVQANKPGAISYLNELKTLLEEWFKYFDLGYQAPHLIDDLPNLILTKLKFIREKLDTL